MLLTEIQSVPDFYLNTNYLDVFSLFGVPKKHETLLITTCFRFLMKSAEISISNELQRTPLRNLSVWTLLKQ